MTSSFHKSMENGYVLSETTSHKRYSSDIYESNKHSSSSSFKTTHSTEERRDGNAATSFSTTHLLFNRDDIVLSYPEKVVPIKTPVISLDVEEDEERIMQADWGNESDDEDTNSLTQKQNKRLSTVERDEIEKKDIESKGIWVMYAKDGGRPYYYNSITRESAWEIPKTTHFTSAVSPKPTVVVPPVTVTEATTITTTAATATAGVTTNNTPLAVSGNIATEQSTNKSNGIPKNKVEYIHTKRDLVETHKKKNNVAASTKTNEANPKLSPGAMDTHMTPIRRRNRSRSRSRSRSPGRRPSRESRHRLEFSHCTSRLGYTRRLTPPPPRNYAYDNYRYYSRSPSPPPPFPPSYRFYPSYDREAAFYLHNDRYADSGSSRSPLHPDIRYRRYDPPPPPPPPPTLTLSSSSSSPPPPSSSYYRSREEHSWNRYGPPHRSRYYR